MAARHRGQRKIGISMRVGTPNREVARELDEDMDPRAEEDLNAAAHNPSGSNSSRRRWRSLSTTPSTAPAVGGAPRPRRPSLLLTRLCSTQIGRAHV